MRYIVIRDARFCRISRSGKRDYRSEIDTAQSPRRTKRPSFDMNRAISAGYRPYPSFLRKRESRSGKFFRLGPPVQARGKLWTPAFERVKELAARPVTSPRLRGEVGICASARGFRVRGNGPLLQRRVAVQP